MELIEDWKLKSCPRRKRIGVLMLGMSGMLFIIVLGEYLLKIDVKSITNSWASWAAVVISVFVVVTVLHEGLHGLLFWIFGGRVHFGAKLWSLMGPVFYASSPGSLIPRAKYQMIALAPQLLTVLLFLMLALAPLSNIVAYALILAAALNVGGGCLDIYATILLRKYPRSVLIEDTRDGFKAYERAQE